MNSKTFRASQTRRNIYRVPEASLLKRVYREFVLLSTLIKKEPDDYARHSWEQHNHHDHS